MISYAFDNEEVVTVDLAQGEEIPEELKFAWCDVIGDNAVFERMSFKRIGYNIPIEEWRDSALKQLIVVCLCLWMAYQKH